MRKLAVFCSFDDFFKLHSRSAEGKKNEKWLKKSRFLANGTSLNQVNI
jgi:hypothetical protein